MHLSPLHAALLVIDVQQALFERPTPLYQADQLLHNINALIGKFRAAQGLVIFIQHSNNKFLVRGTPGWEYHPEINRTDRDLLVHKVHGDAFQDTRLREILSDRAIDTLVITGLVTQGCVRATAAGAYERGYRVILVLDAHSNYSKDASKIIQKWNKTLSRIISETVKTRDIDLAS